MDKNKPILLVVVVDKDKDTKIITLLNKLGLNAKLVTSALGTASKSILDFFGLDSIKKNIIFTIIPENIKDYIYYQLQNKIDIHNPGNGIAFTIKMTSANVFVEKLIDINNPKEEIKMKQDKNYELIITIVNEGYYDEVMDIAKKSGANGGTLIQGRGLSTDKVSKFLGISIDPEKDIIFMLVDNKDRRNIMESITKNLGINTESKAICISLPVDSVCGLEELTFESKNL